MQQDTDPASSSRRTRIIITVVIAALVIVFIALHLTGVIGPDS